MIKAQELAMPTSCLNKAQDDEPIFVLRAKDQIAADIVRIWAMMAYRTPHELWKIKEARELANQMDLWRATQNKTATTAGELLKNWNTPIPQGVHEALDAAVEAYEEEPSRDEPR